MTAFPDRGTTVTDDGVLITKRASRFWVGEIILIDRSHPLITGERVHGFACILRHQLQNLDRVSMYCCLGACRNCTDGPLWRRETHRCLGARITVNLPRSALMIRYKGPLPPPTLLIDEYP